MFENNFVLFRMSCANFSRQNLITLWIPSAQGVCLEGLSANAPDATAPAVPRAGVIIAIFDRFPQFSVRRRRRGGTIGQGYQAFDATFLF
jgi:hypothetical protein